MFNPNAVTGGMILKGPNAAPMLREELLEIFLHQAPDLLNRFPTMLEKECLCSGAKAALATGDGLET
jgi:hypothetical protein